METIPSSFLGYNKKAVNQLIKQKNEKLKTQQSDINYLRTENTKLKKKLKTINKKEHTEEPELE